MSVNERGKGVLSSENPRPLWCFSRSIIAVLSKNSQRSAETLRGPISSRFPLFRKEKSRCVQIERGCSSWSAGDRIDPRGTDVPSHNLVREVIVRNRGAFFAIEGRLLSPKLSRFLLFLGG
jgi:hypothetical protein